VRALDALLSRRQQLLAMRQMESNRLGSCSDATVRAGLERHIAWLGAEAADADLRLAEAVKASPAWKERDELLRSIPGLGPVRSDDPSGLDAEHSRFFSRSAAWALSRSWSRSRRKRRPVRRRPRRGHRAWCRPIA
jgi:transposase